MRVLVTGADGFIGRGLVPRLLDAGHEVTGVVFDRAAGAGEVRLDLTRGDELARLPRGIDAVVHTAGLVDATLSPELMHAVNVEGTRHITDWAKQGPIRHFIHLSSVAVYGPLVVGEGRAESTPRLGLRLGLPYMRTKAMAERVVEASGLPYTMLRPCAVFGPGDTVLTRGFVDALSGAGLPLVPGASPLRRVSLLHISGLAEVVCRLLDRGPLGQALHVADAEHAFGEVAQAYADACKLPLQFRSLSWTRALSPPRDSGFLWLVASARFGQSYRTERLRRELGSWASEPLEKAMNGAVSSLQGGGTRLS